MVMLCCCKSYLLYFPFILFSFIYIIVSTDKSVIPSNKTIITLELEKTKKIMFVLAFTVRRNNYVMFPR